LTTLPTPRVQEPRHIARLVVDYFASRRLVVDYFDYVACPGATACRAARCRLLRLHRASRCLGTSRSSSCGSSLTTSPRAGSYTARPGASARRAARRVARRRLLHLTQAQACMPRVQVPRHVARLVVWLVVDYFTSRRRGLVRRTSRCLGTSRGSSCGSSSTISPRVGSYDARLGASARRAARRRILRLRRASGCLDTSHGMSCGSSSTTPPRTGLPSTTSPTPRDRVPRHVTLLITWLVVDYFAYAMRPGASARRAARCRLLRLRRASGWLGTSRGSSSATSPTPRVRVPRHVARLVSPLVVDYFAYAARPGDSARRAAHHAVRRC
jgi:hypothetical protein